MYDKYDIGIGIGELTIHLKGECTDTIPAGPLVPIIIPMYDIYCLYSTVVYTWYLVLRTVHCARIVDM